MGTTTKRHKLVAEQLERPNEDMISNLPSSLIGYILSFLPTKDAVATSVLSSRWKGFWPMVTRLSIDDYLLQSPESKKSFERLRVEFMDFMDRLLLTESVSGIETFRFHCSQSYDASCVHGWLSSVLKSNVREFDVIVYAGNFVVLPSSLFTCRTLVKLNLGEVFMNVPDSVRLPCLKHVELHGVEFPDDDSISRLLCGCTVLGNLHLKRCMGRNVGVIKISVPTLMHLRLEALHHKSMGDILDGHLPKFHIVLNTPSLLHLNIEDFMHESYVFENSNQLVEARFVLFRPLGRNVSSLVPFEDVHHIATRVLLQRSSKVKWLHFFTEGFNRCELVPKYENLTELLFDTHWNVTLDLLHKLLERSPKLHRLSLAFNHEDDETSNFFKTYDDEDDDGGSLGWDHPSRRVPDCLLFHLKIVEIWNFRGLKKETELVEYLLKNVKLLEKVSVGRAPIRGETLKDCFLGWAWQRRGDLWYFVGK